MPPEAHGVPKADRDFVDAIDRLTAAQLAVCDLLRVWHEANRECDHCGECEAVVRAFGYDSWEQWRDHDDVYRPVREK